MRSALLAALMLTVTGPAFATDTSACKIVSGRMFLTNGTPSVRIRVASTYHVLGVIQQDATFDDLPANLRHLWRKHGDKAMWTRDLVGQFEICSTETTSPGAMELVRVVQARRLRVREHN